jgi:hypothetical protein
MKTASQISGWIKAARSCLQKPIGDLRDDIAADIFDHAQETIRVWRLRRWQASWLQLGSKHQEQIF